MSRIDRAPRSQTGRTHGILRGADGGNNSPIFEGRFGRMFAHLPPARFGRTKKENLAVLKNLGIAMMSQANTDVPKGKRDPEQSRIPAGYTFLGQFIDHDISFDPASSLDRKNDPHATIDYRTPRFDLDSVYGRGIDDDPYLYRADGLCMVLGRLLSGSKQVRHAYDVPRNIPFNFNANLADPKLSDYRIRENQNNLKFTETRAVIGDPRNDENVILAQLHAVFLRFHNHIAKQLTKHSKAGQPGPQIWEVQQAVRWHYQWVILHDFLPRLVSPAVYKEYRAYIEPKSLADFKRLPPLRFYKPHRQGAYIPIEFSAAAYRFGHPMVRRSYRLNNSRIKKISGPFPILGLASGNSNPNLNGRGAFRVNWGIDWDLFFDNKKAQRAHKIDTSLVNPLADLPFPANPGFPSLAERDLVRGWRFGLPSGERVARAMGVPVLPDPKVKTIDKNLKAQLTSITKISPVFKNNTPLWFYILAEAQEMNNGEALGEVGGRIIMETFMGLMLADASSYLRQEPLWRPMIGRHQRRDFQVTDFIRAASQG